MRYFIGVDVGGTNIAAGVVSSDYRIIAKEAIKTNAPRSAESICDDIAGLCRKLADQASVPYADIAGIGVASPGLIKNGVVYTASNLGFRNVPLKKLLEARCDIPCSVCNDANAAALAESKVGSGKGHKSLVAVTIGTGIGGGIVFNGRIHDGFNGAGAEIGHMIIVPDGRQCSCGNRGCFEAYCSANALINDTKEAMLKHPESLLWQVCGDIEGVTGKSAYETAKKGDAVAGTVIGSFVRYLSIGVANIITLLQPEVVCIGGGMSEQGETLIAPLDRMVQSNSSMKSVAQKTKITAAALFNDAGIIGAAADIIGMINDEKQ